MSEIVIEYTSHDNLEVELVERKGVGHPDSLADGLAEYLSNQYSIHTIETFGAILHHNFDKVGLLGGLSHVAFGEGYMKKPIRVLLNGRASTKFSSYSLPVLDMLQKWSREFLIQRFPLLNADTDISFINNLEVNTSPGRPGNVDSKESRKYWFEPRGLDDLPELKNLVANDTSTGVSYFPNSKLEKLVLDIESDFNSPGYKSQNPCIGSDIKVMAVRVKDAVKITVCIPQISKYVSNLDEYISNVKIFRACLEEKVRGKFDKYELTINNRDKYDLGEIYLTAIGSAIESGDEGLVGRGNRINGLISNFRPYTIEGINGKNPVYYAGKVYSVAAHDIARRLHEKYGEYFSVAIVSQVGRSLSDPWIVNVKTTKEARAKINHDDEVEVRFLIEEYLQHIHKLTEMIIRDGFTTY